MAKHDRPLEPTSSDSLEWAARPTRDLTSHTLGDFLVERMLGQGGMGEVYLARQVSLDRPVALKVLRPEWTSNPTYMARFESEAWAAAKLNHPNIVHIYTLGGFEGIRFIAMEYVQGTNLREHLQKKGALDLPVALSIMRQSGLAVQAAGEAGLIHRDIKPENMLLTKKGQLKVADFGLARLPESDRLHLTAPGMTLGTPMYMSPEQVQGREVDHRSDLYSLGVTFYHMLSGSPPFTAETAVALALKHVSEAPESLGKRRKKLPPELVALVMKLMAKSPEGRYQSAGEMLKDLSRVREIVQAAAVTAPITVAHPVAALQPTMISDDPELSQPAAGWRPGSNVVYAIVLLSLIAGGALGWVARAEDLLSTSGSPSASPPGLWMANWSLIPNQGSAAAQYRFAQLHSSDLDREAAWLAVPGRYPKESKWTLSAYIQLARHYLRRGDSERLGALSHELEQAEKGSGTAQAKWKSLAHVLHAGEMAIKGDPGEVAAVYGNNMTIALMDPALAELSLEIVTLANARGGKVEDSERMTNLRNQLLGPIKLVPALLDRPAFGLQ
ncbi:MAG: serine/threonine protein kinase [Planctomycetota bacterium]|nr:serine/threonine protein kinase [Planctomycetota bacterium]